MAQEKPTHGDMFQCGVAKCEHEFRTGVGYLYHLYAIHGDPVRSFKGAAEFIRELNLRLGRKRIGANGYYSDIFNFSDN